MAINAKLGVDIGSFKSGIQEGQNILKGLNAEMKATEAEFKATGNAEKALEQKTKTLNSQLQVQKGIADQAKAALQAMDKAGVEPTDAAYQKMYATMMNATAGMNEAQAALNGLGSSASNAAGQADQLTQSVQGISKKISLDQVLTGINAITTGLENAAKKAVQLGEDIWNAIMDSARWADDTATMAQMYGIDVEKFQQMQNLVAGGLDTSVEALLKAQKKFRKGMGEGSIADTLKELRITASELKDTGGGIMEFVQKDDLQLFWEAGQAIMNMSDAYDKEAAAQKLFGRSWEELTSLFTDYKTVEEYNQALENQQVVSEEAINAGAKLNDKIGELENKFKTLKDSVLLSMAPALSGVADSLNGVLTTILDYLNTPKGQAMLESLGDTVASLFEDLTTVDPNSVLETLKSAFDSIKNGLTWIKENKKTIIDAIKAIGVAFGALKLGELAGNVWKFVDGARTLMGLGGGKDKTPTTTTTTTPEATETDKTAKTDSSGEKTPILDKLVQGMGTKIVLDEAFRILDKANTAAENATTGREWSLNMHKQDYEQGRISKEQYDKVVAETNELFDALEAKVNVQPEVDPDAATEIANEVGPVTIPIEWTYANPLGAAGAGGFMGLNFGLQRIGHANGLPFVPYDGYLAMLHRGERVLTARANRSYTYNSNNYFGNVNLNNGQDIDALCTSIDRHNRRMQSGFGA